MSFTESQNKRERPQIFKENEERVKRLRGAQQPTSGGWCGNLMFLQEVPNPKHLKVSVTQKLGELQDASFHGGAKCTDRSIVYTDTVIDFSSKVAEKLLPQLNKCLEAFHQPSFVDNAGIVGMAEFIRDYEPGFLKHVADPVACSMSMSREDCEEAHKAAVQLAEHLSSVYKSVQTAQSFMISHLSLFENLAAAYQGAFETPCIRTEAGSATQVCVCSGREAEAPTETETANK